MTVQVKTEQPEIAVKTLISSKDSRIKDFLSILMQNKAALAGAII
ncbi:ABC transporter permease, partial [Microbacterium sp. ZXX196]|nr:ABC transporter permease [Microbacterium sp. ZXX196]